jgi:hypothetical protein
MHNSSVVTCGILLVFLLALPLILNGCFNTKYRADEIRMQIEEQQARLNLLKPDVDRYRFTREEVIQLQQRLQRARELLRGEPDWQEALAIAGRHTVQGATLRVTAGPPRLSWEIAIQSRGTDLIELAEQIATVELLVPQEVELRFGSDAEPEVLSFDQLEARLRAGDAIPQITHATLKLNISSSRSPESAASLDDLVARAKRVASTPPPQFAASITTESMTIKQLEEQRAELMRQADTAEEIKTLMQPARQLNVEMREQLNDLDEQFIYDLYALIDYLEGELLPSLNSTAAARAGRLEMRGGPLSDERGLVFPAPEQLRGWPQGSGDREELEEYRKQNTTPQGIPYFAASPRFIRPYSMVVVLIDATLREAADVIEILQGTSAHAVVHSVSAENAKNRQSKTAYARIELVISVYQMWAESTEIDSDPIGAPGTVQAADV